MAEFTDYFDSGVLVKIYHLEPGSAEACERVRRAGRIPLPFLAEMEVRNASPANMPLRPSAAPWTCSTSPSPKFSEGRISTPATGARLTWPGSQV